MTQPASTPTLHDQLVNALALVLKPIVVRMTALEATNAKQAEELAALKANRIKFAGVYVPSQMYQRGNVVTHHGSCWHCNQDTDLTPDTDDGAKVWTLMVKRGRDGRDLRGQAT